jgi:hypothetical protein
VSRFLSLDAELQDAEALCALVLAGLVEMSNCEYPVTHDMPSAPFFDMDGQLCCAVCGQIEEAEERS